MQHRWPRREIGSSLLMGLSQTIGGIVVLALLQPAMAQTPDTTVRPPASLTVAAPALPQAGPSPAPRALGRTEPVEEADDRSRVIELPAVAPEPGEPPRSSGRPELAGAAEPAAVPDATTIDAAPSPVPNRLATTDEAPTACIAALSALGARFERVPAIAEARDSDCGIERPVKVSAIVPGVVLQPEAIMRCPTALALAQWIKSDVLPAARDLPTRGRLTAINHGSTYVCRRRNNRPTGKLSEHAFGNAVDIMGFRFDRGEPLRIKPRVRGGPAARFQRTVRQASCEHFTTVIGPGTDASHADHLHLDIKQRRGGYRFCR